MRNKTLLMIFACMALAALLTGCQRTHNLKPESSPIPEESISPAPTATPTPDATPEPTPDATPEPTPNAFDLIHHTHDIGNIENFNVTVDYDIDFDECNESLGNLSKEDRNLVDALVTMNFYSDSEPIQNMMVVGAFGENVIESTNHKYYSRILTSELENICSNILGVERKFPLQSESDVKEMGTVTLSDGYTYSYNYAGLADDYKIIASYDDQGNIQVTSLFFNPFDEYVIKMTFCVPQE